jgi:hypothetical protein
VRLFRIQLARGEVAIGLTPAEFAALGSARMWSGSQGASPRQASSPPGANMVGRGPDSATRFMARERVAMLRQEALMVEPYAAALPVAPPPAP